MLTRRSRKEVSATSPDTEPRKTTTKKKSVGATSPDTEPRKTTIKKKSTTPTRKRGRSKSFERNVRTRSRSGSNKIPTILPNIILERFDETTLKKKEKIKKKSVEPVDSSVNSSVKSLKSPLPVNEIVNSRSSPFEDKINYKVSAANSSKVDNDDDSDNEPLFKNNINAKTSKISTEFGGLYGNIVLALLLPVLVIVAKIALKTKGNLIPFPRGYLRYANYYNQDVFLWTAAIVILQLFISLVPFAWKSKGLRAYDPNLSYRFSGFGNLIVAAAIVGATYYYKLPIHFIHDIVTKKSVPHVVASVLCAFIIAIVLNIKARYSKQNIKFETSNIIKQLFIGTTSNPTLGPLNIKLALYRYSLLLTILFNYLIIMDSLKNPINIHLYVAAGFQIFYAIDKLIFEYHILPSFYLQKEKDGYWTLIQQFLQPVINVLPIQILLANNLPVNYIIISISSVVFLLGYIFQRYSEFTKYQYEIKSNYAGRGIVNGLWSFVRYPHYLGTILVHLAIILLAFEPSLDSLQTSWPIFFYPLYYIVTLSHRCSRVSTSYHLQYGYTWEHNTVKWNLIPKIF